MNADYLNWIRLDEEIKNAITVHGPDEPYENEAREKTLFDSFSTVGKIENTFAREKGTTIFVFLHAKTSINNQLKKEMVERRNFQDN